MKLKITLEISNASRFSRVPSRSALTNPDSTNAAPMITRTVEAVRPPRTPAAIRTPATTTEMIDSAPLVDRPKTCRPVVENMSSLFTRPSTPNTPRPIPNTTAPTRWRWSSLPRASR